MYTLRRFGENFGIDIEQILAWRLVSPQIQGIRLDKKDWNLLEVYIPGNKITFQKGDEGVDQLLEFLVTRFRYNNYENKP